MGSTVQITQSKNLSFKKLSFLYLVFILFLFFSSPGQYVVHYSSLAQTQQELNARLIGKLKSFNSNIPSEQNLKNVTLECLGQLDKLKDEYSAYVESNKVYGDRLKENHFAEKTVRKGPIGARITQIIDTYLAAYAQVGKRDLTSDLKTLKDFSDNSFGTVEFFFKETPNGVMPSLFEHLRTVFLYNSLVDLTHQNIDLPKFELVTLSDAQFIEKFKRSLILGEKLVLQIKPEKVGVIPTIRINGKLAEVRKVNDLVFEVDYLPASSGKYSIEVVVNDQRLLSGFEVLKPEFNYDIEKSDLSAMVGTTSIITLNPSMLKGKSFEFSSPKANVNRINNRLEITPNEEGLFEVVMSESGKVLDKLVMFAHPAAAIDVALMDIAGKNASLDKANRLECVNPYWQVVNFQMSIVTPDGTHRTLKNATRFLRNELRELENTAPKGSTIVFENIKLVGQKSGSTQMGKPIIMVK